jgi:phosphate transport system substrate-binding protein
MKRTLSLLFVALVGLAGCGKAADTSSESLVVGGAPVMVPLIRDIADRFTAARPGVRISIDDSTAEHGISDVREGLIDVGMVSRPIRPNETGVQVFPLARDGVVVVVNRANPVRTLSDAQIQGLFIRLYVNWREVGGSEEPVVLVNQSDGQPVRTLFLEHFNIQPRQVPPGPTVPSSTQAVQVVGEGRQTIGYASLSVVRDAIRDGRNVMPLPLDGVTATPETIHDSSYPLIRPLHLVTRGKPHGAVQDFIEFARSPRVRDLIEKHGFTPLGL